MNLRMYLAKENMTQTEFAKRIDFHIVYIRDVMAGRRTPGRKLIKAIVQATNGDVTEQDLRGKK